jgi:hypothetical protein
MGSIEKSNAENHNHHRKTQTKRLSTYDRLLLQVQSLDEMNRRK